MARPHTFWSMEYGDFSVWVIGSLCSLANAISTSRVSDRSRIGLIALRVGSMDEMETSKRTWSLPLPVQPWEMVSAPNWWAARTRCLEISGREMAETSGYTPSYMALAFRAFMQYSLANSFRASTTYASTAPQASARFLMVSRLSPPWPTSRDTATTSLPVRSLRYGMATEVSRPPEYASTIRLLSAMGCLSTKTNCCKYIRMSVYLCNRCGEY